MHYSLHAFAPTGVPAALTTALHSCTDEVLLVLLNTIEHVECSGGSARVCPTRISRLMSKVGVGLEKSY